jgi:hypothetical protein
MRIAIAKIKVELKYLRIDLIQKEIAILKLEETNRQDHKDIILKLVFKYRKA